MTSFTEVYEAFLSKILDDEWQDWQISEAEEDWRSILLAAIPWFKFPRGGLMYDSASEEFERELSNEEIQILAVYMKCEWLNRCILTWDNIKPLYNERDFSPANLLSKLNATLAAEKKKAKDLESIYYRAINGRPFDYTKLATAIR